MSVNPCLLRDFEPADQPAVRQLILDGLAGHWGVVDETANPDLDDIASTFRHGRTVVCVDEQGIIGTGTCVPVDEVTAQIVRMSVRGDMRRTGVGRALVEELLRTARGWGASRTILETSSQWPEVIEFYLTCGFVITHVESGQAGCDTWFERDLCRDDGSS